MTSVSFLSWVGSWGYGLAECKPIDRGSLLAQLVKNLSAMQETWVRSLGQEYPLEKETATHSSILAWRIPWTEESGRLQSMGRKGRTRFSD